MKKHYSIFLLCATLIMACATSPTGRRQLMLVSEDSAIAASKQAYVEMLKPYAQQGKIDNDPALKDRVYRITGSLIAQAIKMRPETKGWDWSIKIIDDPETVNAWAMAGGKMALYTGLVLLVFDLLQAGGAGWLATTMVAVGLAGVIAGAWRETDSRGAERLLVLLIETAEMLIGYVSNTLSFLRVAAFSLNHAALAFAVITVAGVMGPAGNWITLLLGNLVILVLEGGIVLIQVLRLEYYEGFVRFFNGNGRAYRPLRLHAFAPGVAGI